MAEDTKIILGYGSDEQEDSLVGTEEGLQNLISACQIALEKGIYESDDLGSFRAVEIVNENYEVYEESNSSFLFGLFVLPIIVMSIFGIFFLGLGRVIGWIFG